MTDIKIDNTECRICEDAVTTRQEGLFRMVNSSLFIPGRVCLSELKPRIESNMILFPVSASSEYVKEDGFSFGYPVDCGWATTVKYECAVGALAEDTIALFRSMKKPTPPHRGIYPMELYGFSEQELDAWREGLDASWAEERYQEWLEKGLVADGETKEQFIANELDNFHCWPAAWQSAYTESRRKLNAPVGKKREVLVNGPLTLYVDDNGDYFFSTPYHAHGEIQKADPESARKYIEEFHAYQSELAQYREKAKQLKENLDLLKSSLGGAPAQ